MDKLFVRKDIYEEMLEKGFGKRDVSKLTKKKITDKNGHTRTVYVRNGEQPVQQQQPKAQDELSPEKKARYEEMLEKVVAGPDDNALFVKGKGMLNKKDAIAHLEGKLGKKPVNSAAVGHLEADEPMNTDITAEDEARFGKEALSGLSGKRTGSEPKHTLAVGSEVKFKKTGQPIKIKKIEQYGDAKIVVGEYDYKGKKEENRFRLDELDYEEEKENNPIAVGNVVKYKRTGQPIKIKDIETYGNDKIIVGEYEHNGKTETNRFRMDEISTESTQDSKKPDNSQKSSDELQAEQDKIRDEYREYASSDEFDEESDKTKKYLEQLNSYDEQIENAKVRETGMTRYVREGYEAMKNVKEEYLPRLKDELEQKVAYEQETLARYKKMKPKNKTQKDSLEVNMWAAQRNIDENLGRLKAINERMGKK